MIVMGLLDFYLMLDIIDYKRIECITFRNKIDIVQ